MGGLARGEDPVVVVVAGRAGAGKSTLGAALARELGAALLDQDVLTGPLVDVVAGLVGAGDDLDDPRLRALVREPRYEVLRAGAADQLRAGTDTVLVAPFTAEVADARAWADLEARLRAAGTGRVVLVVCTLPEEDRLARVRARGAARDRAHLARAAGVPAAAADLVPAAVVVDTRVPLAEQLATVRAALPLR